MSNNAPSLSTRTLPRAAHRLGLGASILLLTMGLAASSAGAAVDSGIAPAESISLPGDDSQYFYVGSTAGDQPMESVSWLAGQDLAVTAAYSSQQAVSIGRSSSDAASYSSAAGDHAIAGAGISGYSVVQTFSAQVSKIGPGKSGGSEKKAGGVSLSLPFTTTQANETVLILAGGQGTGTLALSEVEATTLQNATYSETGSGVLASAAIYSAQLPVGKHKAKWHSTTFLSNAGTSLGVVAYVLAPLPPPTVTSVSPNNGPEGGSTSVTITGTNLTGATAVKFGSSGAASFKVSSATSIEATSPVGAGTVDVTVTTPSGTSAIGAPDLFEYVPPHPVNAYDNYGSATAGHAMCRGNPARPESMPGGTATQTFTIPPGVASLSSALVQIDPDRTVTAHLTLTINGVVWAATEALAAGDTHFSWPAVPVNPGDQAALSISFTATFGKIITVYSAADIGGTLTYSNSCPDGAPSGTTENGLRAVVSGLSP